MTQQGGQQGEIAATQVHHGEIRVPIDGPSLSLRLSLLQIAVQGFGQLGTEGPMFHQVVVNDLAVGAPLAIEQIHGPSPCRIPPVLIGGAAAAMAGGLAAPAVGATARPVAGAGLVSQLALQLLLRLLLRLAAQLALVWRWPFHQLSAGGGKSGGEGWLESLT